MTNPNLLIIGGPNGAGKSTISRTLLSGAFGKCHYVNADAIVRVVYRHFTPTRWR